MRRFFARRGVCMPVRLARFRACARGEERGVIKAVTNRQPCLFWFSFFFSCCCRKKPVLRAFCFECVYFKFGKNLAPYDTVHLPCFYFLACAYYFAIIFTPSITFSHNFSARLTARHMSTDHTRQRVDQSFFMRVSRTTYETHFPSWPPLAALTEACITAILRNAPLLSNM